MRDDSQLFPDPDDLERANQEGRVTQERFTRYDALFLGSCRIKPTGQQTVMISFADIYGGGRGRM
jgi:hypothetical protein